MSPPRAPEVHLDWVQDVNRVMSVDGSVPWKLPLDTQERLERIKDQAVAVGRCAYDRQLYPEWMDLYVLSSSATTRCPRHKRITSPESLLRRLGQRPLYVLGGVQTLQSFLPYATHLHITEVLTDITQPASEILYAPQIDLSAFKRISRRGYIETDEGILYSSYLYMRAHT